MNPFIFWNSPRAWPLSPKRDGVVFLAAAMRRIGLARYAEQWNGREGALTMLPPPNPLPQRWSDAKPDELILARAVVAAFPDGFSVKPLDEVTDFVLVPPGSPNIGPPLLPSDWQNARERIDQIRDLIINSKARWQDITEATFAMLKVGALETVLRPRQGGEYWPAPDALWNTDLDFVRVRFGNCRVDLSAPFSQTSWDESPDGGEHDYQLIFVTTKSLDAILAKMKRALAASADSRPLSIEPRTPAHLEEYKQGIKDAVMASPDGPPEGWGLRDEYIRKVGYDSFRLPMELAKSGYAAALAEAKSGGIDHKWSRRRPKSGS